MRPERKAALTRYPFEHLSEWARQISSWSQPRQGLLTTVAGVGLVVLVVWGGVSLFWHYQTASGLEALRTGLAASAEEALIPDALDGSIRHFETAAARLGGQPRQLALWHLGHAYQQQREFGKAARAYQAVAADAKHGDHYLVQLALLKLGEVAEQAGEIALAKSRYMQAAEIDGPTQSQAFLSSARIFEKTNDRTQAQSYYQKFAEMADNSLLKELVERKLD